MRSSCSSSTRSAAPWPISAPPRCGASRDRRKIAGTFHAIGLAASTLAERRIGALIVIERLEGLRNYIENGIELDAVVSVDLLINLFTPDTPTHDGAVIVQEDRLAAAACFLPLTQSEKLSTELGTRHRAALGITEETDAVAVVVSEETGQISIAFGGEMIRDLESKDLRNRLHQFLALRPAPGRGAGEGVAPVHAFRRRPR